MDCSIGFNGFGLQCSRKNVLVDQTVSKVSGVTFATVDTGWDLVRGFKAIVCRVIFSVALVLGELVS